MILNLDPFRPAGNLERQCPVVSTAASKIACGALLLVQDRDTKVALGLQDRRKDDELLKRNTGQADVGSARIDSSVFSVLRLRSGRARRRKKGRCRSCLTFPSYAHALFGAGRR
jgi:hypothetical protein